MAFSTIQGSGGAPDSFVGTSGVDSIAIANSSGNFFVGAQESNDVVNLLSSANDPGVISTSTLKGGQGSDAFITAGTIVYSGIFLNGNSDGDTIAFSAGSSLNASTVQGGQGNDTITTGVATSSLINGNKNADTLNIGGATASSSFYGGQGADTIQLGVVDVTNTVISGDNDNDTINQIGGASLLGSTLSGGQGNDTITVGVATSTVIANGGDGNDTIVTGTSADTIDGGAGNDRITGGAGIDVMTGGADQDTFVQSVSGLGATATATVIAGTSWSVGDTLTFGNGVDIVTDFTANDLLDVVTAANAVNAFGVSAGSVLTATNNFLQGTYNATTSVFTVGTAASNIDYLVAPSNGTPSAFAANSSLILLDNLGTAPVVANFV